MRENALLWFSEGAKAARARPKAPTEKPPPPNLSAQSIYRREAARRALPPNEPFQTPVVNRRAKVLIKSATINRIEDIEGPRETLQELAKQLTIIAEALITARAQPAQPPPQLCPQTKPTVVKERLILSPLMPVWINGSNKTKVDLKGVDVGGKRILVAVPAETVRKRCEKRYRFRTGFERVSPRLRTCRRRSIRARSISSCLSYRDLTGSWANSWKPWNGNDGAVDSTTWQSS